MLWVILVLVGLLTWAVQLWQVAKKFKNIPGDLGFPIIGNLLQSIKNCWFFSHNSFHNYLENLHAKYGKTYCFWFYNRVMVATSDPILVEKLNNISSLNDKPHMILNMMKHFSSHILTLDGGDEWRLRKKELSTSLRKNSHAIFVEKANKLVQLFSAKSGQFDCRVDTMLMAIETSLASQFGINIDTSRKTALAGDLHFSAAYMISTSFTNPIIGYIAIKIAEYIYFPKEQAMFEEFVAQELLNSAKELKTDKESIIPVGIAIALRNINRNIPLHDMKKEVSEMIGTGSHTIGTATASALVYLATNPHVQEKAWQEQQMIFGDSDRDVTPDDIKQMEYLDRFVNELLRFSTTPTVLKETTEDIDIDGMIIPANTFVTINNYKMRFDSKYWENPTAFEPDRFLNENLSKTPRCVRDFFGHGARSCPGNKYATYNLKLFLSTILRNFKLTSTIKFDEIKHTKLLMVEIIGEKNISVERRSQKKAINS